MAAIIAILLAEFPLNAIAFRLFGEAEILTWVMTAGLAVMLVVCAHGLGTFLRLEQPTMAERRWVWILIAVPVLALVGIALIRARYLSMEAAVTGLNVLGPVVGSLVFLVINLLIYTGATMLSYLAHAPRLAPRVARTDPATVARTDLTDAKQRLVEATRAVHKHEEALSNVDVASDELLRVTRARAAALTAYHRGLMSTYCAANLRARHVPEIPPSCASCRRSPSRTSSESHSCGWSHEAGGVRGTGPLRPDRVLGRARRDRWRPSARPVGRRPVRRVAEHGRSRRPRSVPDDVRDRARSGGFDPRDRGR